MVNKQYCRVHIRPDAPSPQGGQVCWCNEIRPHTRSLVAIWFTSALQPDGPDKRPEEQGGTHHFDTGLPIFGKFSAKFHSFSAVLAPIFASKHAFCSIFQNLPDYLAEFFENWQDFANFATCETFLLKFSQKC